MGSGIGHRLRTREHGAVEKLTDAVGGPARRHVVVLLACVLALQSADAATVGAVGSELERGLRIGNAQLGLLASVTVLMGAVGSIPAGQLVDRVRRTGLLPIAIVVWSAAMVVSGLSVSFAMLLITRLALGAVVAAASPTVASLTGDYFSSGERARIYGFILSGELVGAALGFFVSGEVAGVLSWRWSFGVLAIPGFALAWAIWRHLPEPARGGQSRLEPGAVHIRSAEEVEAGAQAAASEDDDGGGQGARAEDPAQEEVARQRIEPDPGRILAEDPNRMSAWHAVRYVLSIPTNRVLIVASALGYFFLNGLQTFAVVFVKAHFGIGQQAATGLLAVIVLAAIAGAILGGRLADRLLGGGRVTARILVAGIAYVAAGIIFIPAVAIGSLPVAIVLYILGGLALAAPNPPLDAARLDIMPARLWGRAEGVRTVLRDVAQALAPLSFGVLSVALGSGHAKSGGSSGFGAGASAQGLEYTFLIMLSTLLLGGLVMVAARRTYPRDVATASASDARGAGSA